MRETVSVIDFDEIIYFSVQMDDLLKDLVGGIPNSVPTPVKEDLRKKKAGSTKLLHYFVFDFKLPTSLVTDFGNISTSGLYFVLRAIPARCAR